MYILAADAVLVLHAAIVLFVVGGQALILLGWWRHWRWARQPLFRITHLLAISYVALEAWFGVACPLTEWENWLRLQAGQTTYATSFIGHWLQQLLFYSAPAWVFTTVYAVFVFVVVASFVLYPPRRNL